MSNTAWHTATIRIPFANNKHATIAKQVIEVDAELQKDAVKRMLTVEGDDLIVTFRTLTIRLARLSINGFLENLDLVVRTLGEFNEEAKLTAAATKSSKTLADPGNK